MACLAHLGEVQERLAEIRAAGGELIAVSQSRPEALAWLLRAEPRPFPFVGDPQRVAYRAFGLERGGWGMFFRPRALGRYLGLMLRGWRMRRPGPGEDVRQLGGDFILDRNRRLVYTHRSIGPEDRPPVGDLIERFRALSGPTPV